MPSPYVEDPDDEFSYSTDFYQKVGDEDPSAYVVSNDVQELTLVGYVRANKLRSVCRYFVGFAQADESAPWRLRRETPVYHPEFPQMRAYEISARKTVLQSNAENLNGEPYQVELISGERVAKYKWLEVSVRYRNFMFRFREDSEIDTAEEEYKRFTFVETEPRVEALTVTGGMSQLQFAETGSGGGPGVGTPFGAPVAALLAKKGVTVHWYAVPWEYLSNDEDVFNPFKIDDIQGYVNSDDFMGRYPAGTLLAEGYSWRPSTWCVAPEDAADPLRKVDVSMRFTYFDPPRGAASPVARGHNLMPWGGTGTGSEPGGDTLFYLATRDGSPSGDRLIPGTPFSPVFTHCLS